MLFVSGDGWRQTGKIIMKLFEEHHLSHTTVIGVEPSHVMKFLKGLKGDEEYRRWHPQDHISMRWVNGEPWEEGSVCHAVEKMGGKVEKLKMLVTKVLENHYIEYAPVSRFLRRYIPRLTFEIRSVDNGCEFTATMDCRIPLIPRLLFPAKVRRELEGVKKHMREEGENMRNLLERQPA